MDVGMDLVWGICRCWIWLFSLFPVHEISAFVLVVHITSRLTRYGFRQGMNEAKIPRRDFHRSSRSLPS